MDYRSYYLDDFSDEVLPCKPELDAWAEWLAAGGDDEWPIDPPVDGDAFAGSAIAWKPDIVATRVGGQWTLSRDPDDADFVAVRYGEGSGWSPDNIVSPGFPYAEKTMKGALLAFLADDGNGCGDTEYIAVGAHESGWRFTYRAGPPPSLEAERAQ